MVRSVLTAVSLLLLAVGTDTAKVRQRTQLIKGVGDINHYVYQSPFVDAPNLVFIHTAGHDVQIWRDACTDRRHLPTRRKKTKYCNILEQFALSGYGVYAMDLPGHGKSDKA